MESKKLVFDALYWERAPWRISHLITMGSPLVHSEFLSFHNRDELRRSFSERTRAASPPTPAWPQDSMLLYVENEKKERTYYPHFAAPFAAVKWTNIYDKHWFPVFADIVSGPVRKVFGPGVKDVSVKPKRAGIVPPFHRAATHTLYWAYPEGAKETPDWIISLREALDLEGSSTPPLQKKKL